MTTRKYSSISQETTLTSALSSSATTMVVGSSLALLGGITVTGTETFTVVIDPDTALEEIVEVVYPSSSASNTLTIVRGVDSSAAIAHSAGAGVRHMAIGRDLREANTHIENTSSAHGLTIANVVSTTDTSKVSSAMIIDGAVGTAKIDNAAVTEAKIGTSAVTTTKIADLNVTTGKIADSAITSAKIADGAIVDADINATAAIAKTKISGTAITAADTGTVTSTMIADGTIVNADINAAAAIDKTKISGTAITAGDTGTVTSTMIANGTIVDADINSAAAIAATKVSGTAVTQADTGTVTSTMIADGTIVNGDVNASAAIAYSKLNLAGGVVNADIASGAAIALSKLATDPLARANHTGTQTASTISDFNTAVRTNRLDQMAAPTAEVSLNSQKITNLATPTANADASTKLYVDTKINDLIAGAPSTLDTLDEIAAALADTANFSDTVVLKSGSTMTGALNMGTNKVTNVGTPTTSTDAATKGYVDTSVIAPSNLTGPITSVGNATSIASQTGTGTKFVVDQSPTIVTPTLSSPAFSGQVSTDVELAAGKALIFEGTTDNAYETTLTVADPTADRTVTIPDASTTLVGTDTAQTLTNKTINASNNTLTNVSLTSAITGTLPIANGGTGQTTAANAINALLPTQTSNSGKYLKTDGSVASWSTIAGAIADPTEPASPQDGLVWVDTDGTAPTTVVTRWSKAPAAGTTSLSGNDDNNVPLSYSAGYEQVFLNGALLSRANDYTATSGTSITLTTGTVAGDIVEVICPLQISTTDTYTQTAANSVFVAKSENNVAGKNAVINGGFDIWQRGTSTTMTTSAYVSDRWQGYRNATGSTASRQVTGDTTNLPNIQYCLRVQRDSGNTSTQPIQVGQSLETVNSIPFMGKTITLSFYARKGADYSAASNVLNVYLSTGTGTDQNRTTTGYTGNASVLSPSPGTATLTTTWQRFSFTGTTSSTGNELGFLFEFVPVGTASTNDYFEITGVQLELGSVATAFSRAGGTIQGELAACQRYYWRKSNSANANPWFGLGVAYGGGTAVYTGINCPVTMRVSPTSLDYASLRLDNGGSAFTISSFAISTTQSTPDNLAVVVGTTGTTSGNTYNISGNGTGNYIGASAEL